MSTRDVIVAVRHPDNEPWAGALVRAVLARGSYTSDANYPADEERARTGEDGSCTLTLTSALTAPYTFYLPDHEPIVVALPDGPSPVRLEDLRAANGEPPEATNTLEQLLAAHDLDPAAHPNGIAGGGSGGTGWITQTQADARYARRAQNLADLENAATARSNLGLGSAATASSTDFAPVSHVGAGGGAHALATAGVAGFLSAADFSKLAATAANATANATDAQLRDRATHTGTQLAATISDFAGAVRAVTIARYSSITIMTDATGIAWTAMPAAKADYSGSLRHRRWAELSLFTEARLSLFVSTAGATGSEVLIEYSTDNGTTWNILDTGGALLLSIAATTASTIKTSWLTIAQAARTEVLLRLAGRNGNGTASPTINAVQLEVRST